MQTGVVGPEEIPVLIEGFKIGQQFAGLCPIAVQPAQGLPATFLISAGETGSAADLAHHPIERDEAVSQSVPPGFLPDPLQNELAQFSLAGACPQRSQQVDFFLP